MEPIARCVVANETPKGFGHSVGETARQREGLVVGRINQRESAGALTLPHGHCVPNRVGSEAAVGGGSGVEAFDG